MELTSLFSPRWRDYVMLRGKQLEKHWQEGLAASERHVLYILGKGFDPRMCVGLKVLLGAGGAGRRDVIVIDFPEGALSPSLRHEPLIEKNWKEFETLTREKASVEIKRIEMLSEDGRRVGSRNAAAVLDSVKDLASYDDLIIDTSALPRAIFFPLIAKAILLADQSQRRLNLHAFVSEDATLDRAIEDEGVEDSAAFLHGFGATMDLESGANVPTIWMPLLGERQKEQLRSIHDLTKPDEICPILPSPARNSRRSDDLVIEYRELLFDRLRIDSRNFIYASERNPFEVYEQIQKAVLQYKRSLAPLGGAKTVLSVHSSKLMSMGALLVAYEMRLKKFNVGIAHVETDGYVVKDRKPEEVIEASELFDLWLCGECYGA